MYQDTTTVGAVAILEQLTDADPNHERSAATRELAEVMRAWPGEPKTLWWKWFTESAASLGLRTKTLECSVNQALTLANNGIQLVCYRERDGFGQWLAILSKSKRKFEIQRPFADPAADTMTKRRLKRLLGEFSEDDQIRCVVLQPDSSVSNEHVVGIEEEMSPIQRLLRLLQPEASDLWIVVVFAFVVALLMLATPIAVEALVNTVAFGRFLQPIVVLAMILLTFLGFQGAIRALQTYVVEIIQRRLFARVAGDLAFRLPRTETEETDPHFMPEIVNRFFDVVTVQKVAAQLLLDGLGLVLSTFIGMAVLGFYHPWLLGFDFFLLGAIALIIFVLGRGAVGSAIKESKHKYYMASWLEDIARCPTAFRNDGGAEFALERADRLIHEYLDARRKHFRIVMRQVIFALGLQAIASTVLLGLGGWLVVSGELTLGQLVAAELIVTVIVGSFAKFGKHMESFYDLLASVDKLGVLFDVRTERQDGVLAIESESPAAVELHSVGYSWPEQPSVLDNISAMIEPGESVALLGEAGTGKSTLLDLIYGLRDPTSGHLSIDGFDPRNLRPDILRNRVGIARDNEVFHATVSENVHLHRPDVTSTDVRDVLDSLGLLDSILKLEDGCDAMLNSNGAPLSQSQCRMLCIARAAVGKPGLLLIDGCLDALGSQDLERCLDFLLDESNPWTLVIATSRRDISVRFERSVELRSLELEVA